jgi:dTMP kinase
MNDWIQKLAGRFIVFDGPDGSGKSTQLKLLAEFLRCAGMHVTETRDPGGTVIGNAIREILLKPQHQEMTIGCEMLLYMASRTQLMGEVIAPALAENHCVLCDRWVSSTVAYQAAEGKASPQDVLDTYRIVLGEQRPDLTILFDVPAEAGLARIRGGFDRMEAKGPEFHRKVRQRFLDQAAEDQNHFVVLNAEASIEAIQAEVLNCLEQWPLPKS